MNIMIRYDEGQLATDCEAAETGEPGLDGDTTHRAGAGRMPTVS